LFGIEVLWDAFPLQGKFRGLVMQQIAGMISRLFWKSLCDESFIPDLRIEEMSPNS
jgi:hypothetical protein